jgi:hypothetical protein
VGQRKSREMAFWPRVSDDLTGALLQGTRLLHGAAVIFILASARRLVVFSGHAQCRNPLFRS